MFRLVDKELQLRINRAAQFMLFCFDSNYFVQPSFRPMKWDNTRKINKYIHWQLRKWIRVQRSSTAVHSNAKAYQIEWPFDMCVWNVKKVLLNVVELIHPPSLSHALTHSHKWHSQNCPKITVLSLVRRHIFANQFTGIPKSEKSEMQMTRVER